MATLPDLIQRARLELSDLPKPFTSSFQGDGSTTVITLPRKPVESDSVTLLLGTPQGTTLLQDGVDYTLDAQNGVVTLTSVLSEGQLLTASGNTFQYFSEQEWTTFVTTALLEHLHNRDVDLANLPPVEDYPIALYASVQALYVLVNEAASQIDINTPEGVSIPRRQRYEQLMTMLSARMDQYQKIAGALNVGLWRIEMFDLRRVSRTTGRLVPLYHAQEFTDTQPPAQVFVPIDTKGGKPRPSIKTPIVNLQGLSNNDFTYEHVLQRDVTDFEVRANIRKFPQTRTPLARMQVEVLDQATGHIRVSVSGDLMFFIGLSKFWDVQLIDRREGSTKGDVTTVLQGTFDSIRQGNPG